MDSARIFPVTKSALIYYVLMFYVLDISAPIASLGEKWLCCPPFPLPHSLDVGDSWTYKITDYQTGLIRDSNETTSDTLTVTVVASDEFENRVYFQLSDELGNGGHYRVDDEGRTWKRDPERGEILYWDLRPIATPLPEDAPAIPDPPTNRAYTNLENWLWSNGYVPYWAITDDDWDLIGTAEMVVNGRHLGTIGGVVLELPSQGRESALEIELQATQVYELHFFDGGFNYTFLVAPEKLGTIHHSSGGDFGLGRSYTLLARQKRRSTGIAETSFGRLKESHKFKILDNSD